MSSNENSEETLWGVFEKPLPTDNNVQALAVDDLEDLDSFFGPALQAFLAQAEETGWDPGNSLQNLSNESNLSASQLPNPRPIPLITIGPSINEVALETTLKENPWIENLSDEGFKIIKKNSQLTGLKEGETIHKSNDQNSPSYMTTHPTTVYASIGKEPPQVLTIPPFEFIDPFTLIGLPPTQKIRPSETTPILKINKGIFENLSPQDKEILLHGVIKNKNRLDTLNQNIHNELGGQLGIPLPRLKMEKPPELHVNPESVHRTIYRQGETILFAHGKFALIPKGAVNIHQNGKIIAIVWGPNILFEQAVLTGKVPQGLEIKVRTPETLEVIYIGTEFPPDQIQSEVDLLKILAISRRDKIHKAAEFYSKLITALMNSRS